jgi:Holliday junction resolvase
MRRAANVDQNQRQVVAALRAAGCSVHVTSAVGKGFPDAICARPNGTTFVLEIKAPLGPLGGSSHRLMNEKQVAFALSWLGEHHVVRSPEEAVRLVRPTLREVKP